MVTELFIRFIASGDKPSADPLDIINRIVEQLKLDFKREHLLECEVHTGAFQPIDNDSHILYACARVPAYEGEEREAQDLQS